MTSLPCNVLLVVLLLLSSICQTALSQTAPVKDITCRGLLEGNTYGLIQISGNTKCILDDVTATTVKMTDNASLTTKGNTYVDFGIESTSSGSINIQEGSAIVDLRMTGKNSSNLTIGPKAAVRFLSMRNAGTLTHYGTIKEFYSNNCNTIRITNALIYNALYISDMKHDFIVFHSLLSELNFENMSGKLSIWNKQTDPENTLRPYYRIDLSSFSGKASIHNIEINGVLQIRATSSASVRTTRSKIRELNISNAQTVVLRGTTVEEPANIANCTSVRIKKSKFLKGASVLGGTLISI